MIAFDSKLQAEGIHAMQERCLALGLPVWRCSGDGTIIDDAHNPEILLGWLRSPRLRSLVETATRALHPQATNQPVALFAGCWLLALVETQGLHCTGMTVTLMLEPSSLATPEFLEICRAAGVPASEARTAVKSLVRADREAVDQTAATLIWMHQDLRRLERDRITLDQFSNKLSQGYEETNMLFRLARMMNVVSNPAELMEMVCGQLQQVLPFKWVAMKFNQGGAEVPELAGRLIMKGEPPCSSIAFDSLAMELMQTGARDTWTRLLDPQASRLAGVAGSEVIADPIMHDEHVVGVLLAGNKNDEDPNVSSVEIQMIDACADYLGIFHENVARFSEQRNLFMATVQALTASIDAKDRYTCGHSERVALVASQIATGLNMNREQIEEVHIAGLLHDVGKIGVPEAVLCKPAKLTDSEYALVKLHPQIGYDILKDIPRLQPMLPGVLHHHERWDGMGYPNRLAGEKISLMGRILAVADAFDSMSSNRSYRPALPRERVLEEIRRCSGSQFDPRMASAFLTVDLNRFDEMLSRHQTRARQAA